MVLERPAVVSDTSKQREREPPISWSGVVLVFLAPALGGLLYGYDIGATSFVLHMLLKHSRSTDDNTAWWNSMDFRHCNWQQGLTVAAVSLGALAGSHVVLFHLAKAVGRRTELRIAAALYVAGAVLNVCSGTLLRSFGALGFTSLVLGRFSYGMGVGFVMHATPTFLAEMSPRSIRGAVVSAKETVIVFGILMGYWAGDCCVGLNGHWTHLYMVSAAVAVPMFGLTFVIPRSLRWLLMHGHRAEAIESMRFVYTGDDEIIMAEFNRLVASIESSRMVKQSSMPFGGDDDSVKLRLGELLSPPLWPAFRAAMGLIALQQFSGQPSVLSYAAVIFDAAGWEGHASVVTAVLMLCVSSTTVLTVDRFGRKRLLYVCCTVLMTAASTLSWQFWDWKNGAGPRLDSSGKIVVLIAMFTFIGGFQIGFGPITWLIVSEVFPGEFRGAATAMGVELNYLLNFLVQFLVPSAKDSIGLGPTFGMFASIMLLALAFVYHYVPETAGLTLEEIEVQLSTRHLPNDEVESVSSSENSPLLSNASQKHYAVFVEETLHQV